MSIPLTKPFIRRKDMDNVLSCMVEDAISPGEKVKKLLSDLSEYLKTDTGTVYHDPSVGMKYLFQSMGLSSGDGFIISPFCPSYVKRAALEIGLTLLTADVEPLAPVISLASVETLLPQGPKAIYADSCLGYLPHIEGFKNLGLLVIEDITLSMGSFRDLELSGSRGDFVTLFLGDSGVLNAGGGLVVLVGRRKYSQDIKDILNTAPEYSLLGDLNAALALSQFHHLEKIINRKKELFRHLFHKLRKGYKIPIQAGESELVLPWFPVLVENSIKEAASYAKKKGVEALPAFSHLSADELGAETPNAKNFWLRCLLFPMHPGLSIKDAELIGKVLGTLP